MEYRKPGFSEKCTPFSEISDVCPSDTEPVVRFGPGRDHRVLLGNGWGLAGAGGACPRLSGVDDAGLSARLVMQKGDHRLEDNDEQACFFFRKIADFLVPLVVDDSGYEL